ncbi:MAG: polysaccharide deacetylase family protein [Lachnospiraceae bacterium]
MNVHEVYKDRRNEVSEVSGSIEEQKNQKKKIAITFDDGPSEACTGRLLDGLKERQVKASFFVLGQNVDNYPELAKRIVQEGHLIGNHTYDHVELSKTDDVKAKEELKKASDAIFKATGTYPEYMRPPYGECTRKLEDSVDMLLVRWSIDPRDWDTGSADEIVKKVVTSVGENDIILLHDCYDSSVDAALKIIDILEKEGYEFVTVDELYNP